LTRRVIPNPMAFKEDKVNLSRVVRRWIPCVLIVVLIGLLYLNTLGHQFTNWDDGMIYQNANIRNLGWEGIKKIFAGGKPIKFRCYYAIDYRF
jgi:hypothetical protein